MVDRAPRITIARENNARQGFLTPDEYKRLSAELPPYLRRLTCVAYCVANRLGELLRLRWKDVDLDGKPPVFTLWAGATKNNEGRTLPILAGEMMDAFRELERERRDKQAYVFVDADGHPLTSDGIRHDWQNACVRAGLGTLTKVKGHPKPKYTGLLIHDLRRSAIRNMRRAGVGENVAMKISGHKTTSTFRRYDITDFNDLRDASNKITTFLDQASK